ncbi:MAG TPA: cytochrome d ubiquinol oxidase subunit II, partial [Terriglobales bacterium]|jgi:cytochrome d ubiquinol oxidase subunit II
VLVVPALAIAGLVGMRMFLSKNEELKAFLSSAVYILGMLAGAAMGMFPTLLPASTQADRSLNVGNSAAGSYGLHVGLVWWTVGMLIATGYFVYLYRKFAGKVQMGGSAHGY